MIQIQDYQNSHNNQLKALFDKGFESQLILNTEHRLYYPALLKHKFYSEIVARLSQKKNSNATELCWLIVATTALEGNYLVHKAKLQEKYGQKWIEVIDKWLELQESNPVERPIQSQKIQLRNQFEHMNQRAVKYEYFKMKQVPVYLISTEWLQKFYDSTNTDPLPPVDNRHLARPMPFVDTENKLVHLNYEVKPQAKENKDYKIVSPDCWELLYKKFNGLQVKRFTTSEKEPTVQIQYRKLSIHVVEDRYFHATGIQLLVPRFTKFSALVERVKRLFIAYNIVPFSALKKSIEIIKANNLSENQLIDLIQDDQVDILESSDDRFEKVQLQLDIESAKIYALEQQIIFNFIDDKTKDNDLFSKLQSVQSVILRDSCLKCGSQEDVFLCICKSVHFCSSLCQKNHKDHVKQCQKIRKQQIQIAKLIKDYDITQRQIQLTDDMILRTGKVGLQNLRNTCYLNSAIQCILNVAKLVKYFARNDHLLDLNPDNVLGSEGHLACAFGQLIKKYYSTNKRSISPIDVLRIIAKNPQFRGADHQDSQQFLNYFLDKLHEDLNKVKVKPYVESIESNGQPDEQVSAKSWQNYLLRNKSFIQALFAGQYRSQIRCPDCEKISITFDPFMSVTLQFPRTEQTLYIKGYLLARDGEFLKLQANVPPSTMTREFYARTFKEDVVAATIKNKVIKKEWREQLMMSKNFSDEGILLFYIREQGWERIVDLHFLDEKKEMMNFNRRIYIKNPESLEQLKRQIYSRNRYPIQKALDKQFQTEEQYISECESINLLLVHHPSESSLQFPLPDQPLSLRLVFNPQIKLKQKPKFNLSLNSYEPLTQFKSKDYSVHGLSIHDMLQNFCLPQRLTEDNMWYCNKCKDHKMADKIMRIYKLPEVLILHLKRFNHKNTRYRNLIGVQKIDLRVKLDEFQVINGQKYELIGVVNHSGSMTFGHYTAYVKKDEWMKYDDETVRRANVNGDLAYLVVYKKCPEQN